MAKELIEYYGKTTMGAEILKEKSRSKFKRDREHQYGNKEDHAYADRLLALSQHKYVTIHVPVDGCMD